jgi:23S rRNA (uracil1939-C5)-methyltransferase
VQLSIRNQLPQIELAVGEPDASSKAVIVLIFRIMAALSTHDETLFKTFADAHHVQIWTQTKGPDTIKPFYVTGGLKASPVLAYSLPEFDLVYPFKPNEFTQVNPQINRVMIRRAMQLLKPKAGENIADFFCGIGNFTLPIARSGATVLGLEGLANLVERANESAQLNGISQVKFGVADLFKMTEESLAELGKFDKWLIDPPRDGAFELVKSLKNAVHLDNIQADALEVKIHFGSEASKNARAEFENPNVIVYVSCNPATLARDAGVLVHEKGYTLSAAGVINMFPHTAHVESIALFSLP